MSRSKSWIESICCCLYRPPPYRRDIKLGCFGIDGSGKSTVLKLIKGEDPRNVLTTNGFSVLDMEFDDAFHLTVYDVGGAKQIRDIWSNYYAEVHGLIFVVDLDNEDVLRESIDALQSLMKHPHSSKKPILFVLNNKNNGEVDDVEFSNTAGLQAIANVQQQMVLITHVNRYSGHLDNTKTASLTVQQRSNKDKTALQEQFCAFIDLIVEHYVYLSEGVRSAEIALRIKQQEDKDKRRLKLMQDEHNQRLADIAGLEGRTVIPKPVAQQEPEEEDTSPIQSLASSTIPSELTHDTPDYNPHSGNKRLSQASTQPASPGANSLESKYEKPTEKDSSNTNYFLPPKSPGRYTSRMSRIQSALSNRIVPT
ncbi:unnamed protein product [Caenorhabditis auriculariae]|uniref:ADP-ribosylation factor-like protein 13B n=1 Tax=Caenorhabditis auriculariae TaxID=2777116 RepID=A0A8S1GPL6_9PELO|nr:unnamed protein product [Caenorhabditis auriculariae]